MTDTATIVGTAVKDESLGEVSATGSREATPAQRARVEQANDLVRQAYALLLEDGPGADDEPVFEDVMPVGRVQWIHIDRVQANDYNPNAVAMQEMKLLHTSISSDGYTQPVVAIWDPDAKKPACTCFNDAGDGTHARDCDVVTWPPAGRYIIVDGYHRYTTMRKYADIYDATAGYLPVVVLDKPIADRIASTVRHNRARGKHSVAGMGNLVFQMLDQGEDDATICNKLGLEAEELARLKHITGYSKLYRDREYSRLSLTKTEMEARRDYAASHPGERIPQF
jgi:hypothetical protein